MKGLMKLIIPLFMASILVFTGCGGNQQTTTTNYSTNSQTITSTHTLNPVQKYAQELGLSDNIISMLQPLGVNGMDENEQAFIDYLAKLSTTGVVSDEVLQLALANYGNQEVEELQSNVIKDIMKIGISSDVVNALTYLSTFPGNIQRKYIESGIDDITVQYLILNSSLENQEFAKYAIENRLCLQDKKLTNLEKNFLAEPDKYAQELLDEYLSELQQSYPELAKELMILPELQPTTSNVSISGNVTQKVYLLVATYIYEPLKLWLDRWIDDVEQTGIQVITKIITNETPSEIRALLQNMPGLNGCFMVGDIPAVMFEDNYASGNTTTHEEFPTDLYFEDLDGTWLDTDNNGIYDTHTGNIAPELWLGRLKASNLPSLGNEVDLLRNYFDKDHLYRIGALTLPNRALMYIDEINVAGPGQPPWTYEDVAQQNGWESLLSQVYDNIVAVTQPEATNAADYSQRLPAGWSFIRLFVHGDETGHSFLVNGQWDGQVHSNDIAQVDPKAFFYAIVSCKNFNYTVNDYIGGCYVFSKSFSLLGIGDSGVHDSLVVIPDQFFPRLKTECFGSALLHYLQACVTGNARVDSVHNTIIIGDPLLTITNNGQDSDGDGLADKYEVSVGLDPNKIDSNHNGVSDLEEAKLIEFFRYVKINPNEKIYTIKAIENILNLVFSNDPEVKEAFDLMIKGGTPNQADFTYTIPTWNTELAVLYNLAKQNEFDKNDTIAPAIAMDNGLWITMGDDDVRQAVYKDTNDLLNFFRETDEIQKARGYYQLKGYPLEVKIALTWTGSSNIAYYLMDALNKYGTKGKQVNYAFYSKITVQYETLKEMRKYVVDNWLSSNIDDTIKKMENLYIMLPTYWAGSAPTWNLGDDKYHNINDANFVWDYFKNNGKGIGVCTDEATFVNALLKSIGIATITIEVGGTRKDNQKIEAHSFILYFNSQGSIWKSFQDQVSVVSSAYNPPYWIDLYIPPIKQQGLLKFYEIPDNLKGYPLFAAIGCRPTWVGIDKTDYLVNGIPSTKLKEEIILPFYLDRELVILWNSQ